MARLALDRKAENVLVLDMTRVSGLCDHFVICSASSKTRGRTIAEHIETEMKKLGTPIVHRDGLKESDWIVLDYSDVVVHIFLTELRKYYDLESLWGDAPRRAILDAPAPSAKTAKTDRSAKPVRPARASKSSKK